MPPRPARPWWSLLVAAALVLATGCSCVPRGRSSTSTYREALEAPIVGFDPATANDISTPRVLGGIYQGLMQYHYLDRPYRVVPDLAASMPEVGEDGLVYTFSLRQDVRYHPDDCFQGAARTRTVTSGDFVHAFQRVADPAVKSGGWWCFSGWIEGIDAWRDAGADYTRPVSGLETPDPHTLRIRLTRPYPQLLYILSMTFAAPIPPEATRKYGDELQRHPVGTGPFRLKKWTPGHRVVLEKNPDYHDERYPSTGAAWARDNGLLEDAGRRLPLVDRVEYRVIKEHQTRWLSLLRGEIDQAPIPKDAFATAVTKDHAGLVPELADQGLRLQVWPSQTLWWLGMNLSDPAFAGEAGRHLRRAIAHAHDPRAMIRLLFSGRGQPAQMLLPSNLPSYDLAAVPDRLEFDLEKARAALVAAGYPGGEGAPALRIDMRGVDPDTRQVGEYLRQELATIGLEAEVALHPYAAFEQRARQRRVQLYWRRWIGDYPDEENWTQLLYGGNAAPGPNYTTLQDPEVDRLHEATRTMTDSPERRRMVGELMNRALSAPALRPSLQESRYFVSRPRLANFMDGEPIYNGAKYLRVRAPQPTAPR